MKNQTVILNFTIGNLFRLAAFFFTFSFSGFTLYGQNASSYADTYDELKAIEKMKKDGLPDVTIQKWISKRKELSSNAAYLNKTPNVNASGTCADMGAENGWGAWEAATGDYNICCLWQTPAISWNATGLTPTSPRFNIMSGSGIDGCTPGPNPGNPPLTYVAPGFGNASIQLGQPQTNGVMGGCNVGCVERLTYNLQVMPSDTNLIYAYAIVLENPCNTVHHANQVPFAEIFVLDHNGDTIPCSHHKYMGDTTGSCTPPPGSGMYPASCIGLGGPLPNGNGWDVSYKPWTIENINLAQYVGTIVKVVLINADCEEGAHYCYSYWDFKCSSPTPNAISVCAGQQTTIVGPSSSGYTYTWYQNHNLYSGLPNATSPIITPTPIIGDTFSVHVQEPSGCSYWMSYVPELTTLIPAFTFSGTCGSMAFTDNSTVSPASPNNNIVAWNWQFPGGNPAASSLQNPGTIQYPPGTYTVTLVVTSSAGCSDTIKHSFTGSTITATASNTTLCSGQNPVLTASGGTNYLWSNGATTSSITPAVTSNTTYTVIVSSGSCVDTAYASVFFTPSPSVNLGNNQTICTAQPITLDAGNTGASYLWSNGATTQTIIISGTGTYWVIAGLNNCLAKDTVSIFLVPAVHLFDSSLCTVLPMVLDAGSGASSYLWSNGSTSQSISVDASGNYWVEVMYGNCKTSDTSRITGDGVGGTLYVPNAFTPNDDHLNEMFLAKGTGINSFDMKIFDRWGNLIFVSNDINQGWNGIVQGGHYILKQDGQEAAQEDVYVCIIDYTTECAPKVPKKQMGTVTILK